MPDIIIIGAGTAGLTAAIYCQRAGKEALVLEGKSIGGQIVNTPEVENYPGIAKTSGFDFVMGLLEQAKGCGATVKTQAVLSVEESSEGFIVHTKRNTYEAKALIIASGAANRTLGLQNENELIGKGISYCATCDGAFYKKKNVAVIGGGNTALEDAAFLSNYCKKVYLVHRRNEFRGEPKSAELLRQRDNVEMVLDSVADEILADDRVKGLVVKNVKNGEKRTLDVDGIFVAIGQVPQNSLFANLVSLDEKGYIIADESCETVRPGIFTAGDCRTKKVRQLTTAASDGAVAALAACEYIDRL